MAGRGRGHPIRKRAGLTTESKEKRRQATCVYDGREGEEEKEEEKKRNIVQDKERVESRKQGREEGRTHYIQ